MKINRHLALLLIIFLLACENKLEKNCFPPALIVQELSDTLKPGERYLAKMYISDTIYYRVYLPENKNFRIVPVMKLNGQMIKVVEDTGLVEVDVNIDSASINEANRKDYVENEWTGTLMFPNPDGGDVILSKFVRYYIDVR